MKICDDCGVEISEESQNKHRNYHDDLNKRIDEINLSVKLELSLGFKIIGGMIKGLEKKMDEQFSEIRGDIRELKGDVKEIKSKLGN